MTATKTFKEKIAASNGMTLEEWQQHSDQLDAQRRYDQRNAGKPWTKEDDVWLIENAGHCALSDDNSAFNSDMPRLCTVLGRTEGGIKARISVLNDQRRSEELRRGNPDFYIFPPNERTQFEGLVDAWRKTPRASRLAFLKHKVKPELWSEAHQPETTTLDGEAEVLPPMNLIEVDH